MGYKTPFIRRSLNRCHCILLDQKPQFLNFRTIIMMANENEDLLDFEPDHEDETVETPTGAEDTEVVLSHLTLVEEEDLSKETESVADSDPGMEGDHAVNKTPGNSPQEKDLMPQLDEYINLEARVTGRMVLLDISATGEENVIEFDENKPMNDLTYRKKQLQKLQEEVVDLEEISGGISITDLTLNDFLMDLMDYMKTNRKKLDHAPLGMYAVVSPPDELKEQMAPGVIFALQQVNDQVMVEEQNTLYPYYLVYIGADGRVKYNYLHAKKVLDYFKKCCAGQTEVLAEWVAQFNTETGDGRDMGLYSQLLEIAIANIIGKKEEVGVASLFTRGGTTLQKDSFSGLEDFELISFLVVK